MRSVKIMAAGHVGYIVKHMSLGKKNRRFIAYVLTILMFLLGAIYGWWSTGGTVAGIVFLLFAAFTIEAKLRYFSEVRYYEKLLKKIRENPDPNFSRLWFLAAKGRPVELVSYVRIVEMLCKRELSSADLVRESDGGKWQPIYRADAFRIAEDIDDSCDGSQGAGGGSMPERGLRDSDSGAAKQKYARQRAIVFPCSECGGPVSFLDDALLGECEFCGTDFQLKNSGQVLIKIECMNCGADLHFEEGMTVIFCGYCRHHYIVTNESAVPKYMVPLRTSQAEAASMFRGIGEIPAKLCLLYLPFWRTYKVDKSMNFHQAGAVASKGETFEPDPYAKGFGIHINLSQRILHLKCFQNDDLDSSDQIIWPKKNLPDSDRQEPYAEAFGWDQRHALVFYPVWVCPEKTNGAISQRICDGVTGNMSIYGRWNGSIESGQDIGLRSEIFLISCYCASCGKELKSKTNAEVFLCDRCGNANTVDGRQLITNKVRVAVNVHHLSGEETYLPYWRFRVHLKGKTTFSSDSSIAEMFRFLDDIVHIYFPAFIRSGWWAPAFDPLAVQLFSEQPELRFEERCVSPERAAVIPPDQAKTRYAKIFQLAFDARGAEVGLSESDITAAYYSFMGTCKISFCEPELVMVPSEIRGDLVQDGIFGKIFPLAEIGS